MLCAADAAGAWSALPLSDGVEDRAPDPGRGLASGDGTAGLCTEVSRVGWGATGPFGAAGAGADQGSERDT